MTAAVTLASNGSVLTTPVGTAPGYLCRAWVNFNGTGTVAIRASGNVSSITDNGTGAYTVNFSTAMPDANYSAVGSAPWSGGPYLVGITEGFKTTSSVRVDTGIGAGSSTDVLGVNVVIFR